MATFKTIARKPRADGFYHVYIRVTHNRRTMYINTDKMVTKNQLSPSGEVMDPFVLKYCTSLICHYQDLLNKVDTTGWALENIMQFLRDCEEDICFRTTPRCTLAA